MQQKVQFIAALVHDPELVILDEPFSGLDPINAQALKDTVVELKRRRRTVIFSTHVMDSAERMCDFVCIIARGEKALDGDLATVKAEHGGSHVALSLEGGVRDGGAALLADRSLVERVDARTGSTSRNARRMPRVRSRLVSAGARISASSACSRAASDLLRGSVRGQRRWARAGRLALAVVKREYSSGAIEVFVIATLFAH